MRYFFCFLFFFGCATGTTSQALKLPKEPKMPKKREEKKVLFRFQGGVVTVEEYKEYLFRLLGRRFLSDFIDEKLVEWKAKQLGVEVEPDEVEDFVGKRLGKLIQEAGGRERLIKQLEERGLRLEDLIKNLRRNAPLMIQLKKILLKERLRKELLYRAYQQRFGAKVVVRLVYSLFQTAYEEAARKKAYHLARKVLKKIRDKKLTFEQAAKLYSEAADSAKRGGSLGWVSKDQLTSEKIVEEVEKLEPGQISPLVETSYGYHILYLKGRRGNYLNLYHLFISKHPRRLKKEEKEQIQKRIYGKFQRLYQKIQKGEITFEELFQSKEKSWIAEIGEFRLYSSRYGRKVEKVAFALRPREVSSPVKTKKGCFLIQLIRKEPPLRPFDEKCQKELERIVRLQDVEEKEILELKKRLRREGKVEIVSQWKD